MEQTWLTVDELAAVLKVSPKSIRRPTARARFPWIDSAGLCASTWNG
jgi:hypothetical protein